MYTTSTVFVLFHLSANPLKYVSQYSTEANVIGDISVSAVTCLQAVIKQNIPLCARISL